VERGNHYVEGSALDALGRIRFAELGRLFPLRDGGIGWHDRNGPASPPAPSLTVDCTDLTGMWKVFGLGRLRNRVVVSGGGTFGGTRPPDEYRSVNTSAEFLQLAGPGAGVTAADVWAETILDALDPPSTLTLLGTLVPYGAEVKPIVTAEFGARWNVETLDGTKVVQVLGERVTLSPGVLEIDAVTEDVVPPVPFVHVAYGTGSGGMYSSGTSYATARSGPATALFPQTTPPVYATQFFVGQTNTSGSAYEVWESFVWFDTSAIPVGATIVEATFAAAFAPHWLGPTPPLGADWTHFDVEIRSGYGWLPTLALADWRPGAGIAASYPLRATINTARAIKDSFATWSDAGAGLAGAIVKGGQTQLFIVSSRTVAGTPPVSTLAFEDAFLSTPRLRVRYTLP
jgi:hypothetical protein